jgi:hypothetical protein
MPVCQSLTIHHTGFVHCTASHIMETMNDPLEYHHHPLPGIPDSGAVRLWQSLAEIYALRRWITSLLDHTSDAGIAVFAGMHTVPVRQEHSRTTAWRPGRNASYRSRFDMRKGGQGDEDAQMLRNKENRLCPLKKPALESRRRRGTDASETSGAPVRTCAPARPPPSHPAASYRCTSGSVTRHVSRTRSRVSGSPSRA